MLSFLGFVTLGLAHGMILLPVVLYWTAAKETSGNSSKLSTATTTKLSMTLEGLDTSLEPLTVMQQSVV
jgi:hypothetical protein